MRRELGASGDVPEAFLLASLGEAYEALGDRPAAAERYEQAVAIYSSQDWLMWGAQQKYDSARARLQALADR